MKGYKATYNMKCRDVTYKVGETYTTNYLQICESGFHFCKEMPDTLNYYNGEKDDFILLEVEALGDIQDLDDKCATDRIKILRVVPPEEYTFVKPITTFDDNGCVVYRRNASGREKWYEYKDGRATHMKRSDGYEVWYEYTPSGKLSHTKDTNGYETWYTYNEDGRLIDYKSTAGEFYKYEYTASGEISYSNINNWEDWYTYDENDRVSTYKNSNGSEYHYTYDENGRQITTQIS